VATKKQRRLIAQQKREKFLESVKAEGLEAQRRDHERREAKAAQIKAEAEEENRRIERILITARLAEALGVTA
jgi:hypothetical protein